MVEKEPKIAVMRFAGQWKDLGTWNTLTEAMEESCVGDAILNETCENVHVINELAVPVLCMGLKDVIVSASGELPLSQQCWDVSCCLLHCGYTDGC